MLDISKEMIVIIDNMQWADEATMNVISDTLFHDPPTGATFIMVSRDKLDVTIHGATVIK